MQNRPLLTGRRHQAASFRIFFVRYINKNSYLGAGLVSASIRQLLRRIGVVALCYALALQGLIVGIATTELAAETIGHGADVLLCLSAEQNNPLTPADQTNRHSTVHCIYCFAGAHSSGVIPPDASSADWSAGPCRNCPMTVAGQFPSLAEFSLAKPRGPPISG